MNVLIVGTGKGTWQMRGLQLGAAIGARVTSHPTALDVEWADLIVLVKRALREWGPQLQGKAPIVWDALDFWSQPAQNGFAEPSARLLFEQYTARVKPDLIIGATESMARFMGGVYVPHHSWQGLEPTPAREHVQVVAYEGNPTYLGRWAQWLQEACEKRGWSFLINPPDLRQADVLVAFRDGPWDGWICREWKSGVKLVNAMAAGRPIITHFSAAFGEVPVYGSSIETHKELDTAFDRWTLFTERHDAVIDSRASEYTLAAVAEQYRQVLERVGCPA